MKKSFLAVAAASFCLATVAAFAAEPSDGLFGQAGVSDQAMSQLRGGKEAAVNIDGKDSHNLCIACSSGADSISGNAFSHASGIFTIIQNTGNNALLQNATVVNISIR